MAGKAAPQQELLDKLMAGDFDPEVGPSTVSAPLSFRHVCAICMLLLHAPCSDLAHSSYACVLCFFLKILFRRPQRSFSACPYYKNSRRARSLPGGPAFPYHAYYLLAQSEFAGPM